VVDGRLLYFGLPITRYHIVLRRGRKKLNMLRFIGALVWAAGVGCLFFWLSIDRFGADALLTTQFWIQTGGLLPLLFWLAVLGVGYGVYRWIIDHKPKDVIVPNAKTQGEEQLGNSDNEHSAKKHRVDISHVFTDNAQEV